MSKEIPADGAVFLESGISLLVGTRGPDNRPTALRATGIRVHADRRGVDVFLPARAAARTVADLEACSRVAVTASRIIDYRTFQLKGTARAVRDGREDERDVTTGYIEKFAASVEEVGMPRIVTRHVLAWPAKVIEIAVEEIFDQTPGPNAGVPFRGSMR